MWFAAHDAHRDWNNDTFIVVMADNGAPSPAPRHD